MRKTLCKGAGFRCASVVGVLILSGCGQSGPTLAPIKGSVTRDGKPLAEAKITLHPKEPQPAGFPQPIAYADEAGRFVVTSLSHGDGALPGKYTVTVELRDYRQAGEEMIRDGKNLLPPRFADPASSEINREVADGENNWDPLEIPAR